MFTRGTLALVWLLILGLGGLGAWQVARVPDRDPATERAMDELRKRVVVDPPPPPLKRRPGGFDAWSAEPAALTAYAGTLVPRVIADPRPQPPVVVPVQALAAAPAAKASLDGVALTWTLERGAVALERNERPKDVKPAGVRVQRSTDRKDWKDVATLPATATSWADVEASPRTSYAYRVLVEAPKDAKEAEQGASVAEARTPSDRRARLVGGDAKVAILRVEAYNRKTRAWEGRERAARPGDELWPGGWKLSGLKFKGFRLVAEAVDDDGLPRELTTD